MKIQINERHVSPHATKEHAEQLIAVLRAEGWPVEYSAGKCLWDFNSHHGLFAFETDFERFRDELCPAYVWYIRFPCDCRDEEACDHIIEEPVTEARIMDYEGARDKLEKPVIPVEFIQDFFAGCATETLADYLSEGKSHPAVETLTRSILWANDLKREADRQGGKVSPESNRTAVEMLLAGWEAMRELGLLK